MRYLAFILCLLLLGCLSRCDEQEEPEGPFLVPYDPPIDGPNE